MVSPLLLLPATARRFISVLLTLKRRPITRHFQATLIPEAQRVRGVLP